MAQPASPPPVDIIGGPFGAPADRLANTPEAWSARAATADPLEAVGWTPEGQADRFLAVLDALAPRSGESLLDFGCGTGAFADQLPKKVEYVGVDWARAMVARAQSEHPGRSFAETAPERPFELVACIGPFNLSAGWSNSQTWQTLRMLWAQCTRALAVCLYAGTDERCIRYEPGQLLAFAQSTAPRWSVALHRPNDLLLVLHR